MAVRESASGSGWSRDEGERRAACRCRVLRGCGPGADGSDAGAGGVADSGLHAQPVATGAQRAPWRGVDIEREIGRHERIQQPDQPDLHRNAQWYDLRILADIAGSERDRDANGKGCDQCVALRHAYGNGDGGFGDQRVWPSGCGSAEAAGRGRIATERNAVAGELDCAADRTDSERNRLRVQLEEHPDDGWDQKRDGCRDFGNVKSFRTVQPDSYVDVTPR